MRHGRQAVAAHTRLAHAPLGAWLPAALPTHQHPTPLVHPPCSARELGASYVVLKAPARLVASMQRHAAASPPAAAPSTGQATRKRSRARTAGDTPQQPAPQRIRHPLAELTLGADGVPAARGITAAPSLAAPPRLQLQQPGSSSSNWLRNAARKPPRV